MFRMPSKLVAFGGAFLLGTALVVAAAIVAKDDGPRAAASGVERPALEVKELAPNLSVAGQIGPGDVEGFRFKGFRAVIDLRPDGEEAGQASSKELAALARNHGMGFAYIPVPQGHLPDEVADQLGRTLAAVDGPVLLYCRSGRRAARAWALAEASRPDGLAPQEIAWAVQSVGQTAEDLAPRIEARAAQRQQSN